MLALMIGILLLSSFLTELIGIHALFGAFLAGVMMPSTKNFRGLLIERTEYISITLLLPLFFAFSGLRTQIGLLNTVHAWVICGAILLVAIAGKLGGSLLAARFVGESWKNSIIIGALINTRGLMELVVLNIGYDLGILSSEIFTMMIIMALVTTCMTGPILNLMKANKEKSSEL
jgi:Kef-type K+ transport system membrane component KefB